MGEPSELNQRPPDPADALADMAAEQGEEIVAPADTAPAGDPLEALNEMGADRPDSAAHLERLSDSAEEQADGDAAAGAAPAELASPAYVARRRVPAAGGAGRNAAVPLLAVLACLLVLVGVLGATMVLSASREETAHSQWYTWMSVVTIVSFPVAAVLSFGAWWFHQEAKRR